MDTSRFCWQAEGSSNEPAATAARIIRLPAGLRSKRQLMDRYARQLSCPWFGENWDALSDALRDLSWLGETPLVIEHADIPLAVAPHSRATYLSILQEAIDAWSRTDPSRLTVRFPGDCEASLKRITAE